jgi:hypothetical protein
MTSTTGRGPADSDREWLHRLEEVLVSSDKILGADFLMTFFSVFIQLE